LDQLADISEKAKKENRLEKMLDKMEGEWKDLRFELTTFRESGIPILQGQNVEEIQLLLDEHTLNAQTIRSSPDVAPMEERATNWERLMVFLQEVLEVWIKVQANYLYLEPIFHSEDIIKKLPQEAQEFFRIDKVWREIMSKV
jgi:dynein heavy chain